MNNCGIKNQFPTLGLALGAALCISPIAAAQDTQQWTGKGELGFVSVNGNSQSEVLNLGVGLEKKSEHWEHISKIAATRSENEGADTAENYTFGFRSQYLLSERSYTFGDFRYFNDKMDSFTESYILGAGYGYKVVLRDDMSWDLSLGLGYKKNKEKPSFEDISGEVLIVESKYIHKLTSTTTFENYTRIEPTSDNSFVQNIASLSVAISTNLALKLSHDARYNSEPTEGSTSTDTITSASVVYNF